MIRPVGYNVLIKPLVEEEKYGALHLPDTAKGKPCDGIVVAIGEWCGQVKPGDWIVFSRRQAKEVQADGEEFIIVDERACLVVLTENGTDNTMRVE